MNETNSTLSEISYPLRSQIKSLSVLIASVLCMANLTQVNATTSPTMGGNSGTAFIDAAPRTQEITDITINAGSMIYSIQGNTKAGQLPKHGGTGGVDVNVKIPNNEYLVRSYGSYNSSYLGQISFVTNKGKVLGPYGNPTYPKKWGITSYLLGLIPIYGWVDDFQKFDYTVPTGEAIAGFVGKALNNLFAIGFVSNPELADLLLPSSLKGISPPSVPGLLSYDSSRSDIVTPVVVNKNAAIALGKALFWDQQIGSDGQACASCHFHAGADTRIKNQVSPGLNHGNTVFNATSSGASKSGPNYTLKKEDFPFNPSNDDVTSSAGTYAGPFHQVGAGLSDTCDRPSDPIYNINGVGLRKVEPRNSPTMINAAYNHRNFWDGRANNVFNGVSPFGLRDKTAGVYINMNNALPKKPLNLINSSLASQAVGPVLSNFEMSCDNRQFADVGRKILAKRPLDFQTIDPQDSVLKELNAMIGASGKYADLVKLAFNPAYWNVNCNGGCGKPGDGSAAYSQMEANFSMYFGLAVQLYEATLVSDDSKFDKWKSGTASLTAEEQLGHDVFNDKGKCASCHNGPLLTSAAIETNRSKHPYKQVIERMRMRDGGVSIYDEGFYNTAVVPNDHDVGVGGLDPWNNPLSFSKQYQTQIFVDKFSVDPCDFEVPFSPICSSLSSLPSERLAVIGAFKTPGLRNIALTGPYMHNGSMSTLEQVVDFYNRGGNFDNFGKHPDMEPLGLSASERSALVAFMKTLTDDRVAYEKAPFDHPSLTLSHGHVGNENSVTAGNPLATNLAQEETMLISAVGSSGRPAPLSTFEEKLPSKSGPGGSSTPTQVNMSGAYNITAFSSDYLWVANGGFDGNGYAYSAKLLGTSVSWSGMTFNLAAANGLNAKWGGTVNLPAGSYGHLLMLGGATNGAQLNQTVIVTYTDGSKQTLTQSFADWANYQDFPNQGDAKAMSYRLNSLGIPSTLSMHLWGYNLTINPAKTVKSVTLPNNRNVGILAMWLAK